MGPLENYLESLRSFWLQLGEILPKIAGAVIVLIVGWLVAKLIRRLAIKLLKAMHVDTLAEKSGIEDFLLRGGVRYTAVTLIANMLYWLILFTFALAVLNSMGLSTAADVLNKIIFYVPNVIVAVLLLMFGTVFAKFIQGVSYTYLNNIGISGAHMVSLIAQWAIIVFVVSATLEQLAIGGQILISAFQIAFGALCLALALAFGLGGKEWASQILGKMLKK
jgi:hypothetical protein